MNLYFSPLACSLATRIALYEAGEAAEYTEVDLKAKRLGDGTDYFGINPLGQVPALRLDEGALLTENAAVLQYVADRFPEANLAPFDASGRVRLAQWLAFISTELHKAVFGPILDRQAPEAVKAWARDKAALRLGLLNEHLGTQEYLLDRFTVADAYLATVLNWAPACGIDLGAWPALGEYHARVLARPAVAKAVAEEWQLYKQQQARAADV